MHSHSHPRGNGRAAHLLARPARGRTWMLGPLIAAVALAVAAIGALAPTAAASKPPAQATDFDWEEITYRNGKVVNVRRGKKTDRPYAGKVTKAPGGVLLPEPSPEPGTVFPAPGSSTSAPHPRGAAVSSRLVDGRSPGAESGGVTALTAEMGEEAYGHCKTVRVSEEGRGFTYFNTLYRFWLANHFCWDYPRITSYYAWHYFTDREGIDVVSIDGGGYYYYWRGSARGGHYAMRQAHVRNCPGLLGWIPGPDCTGSQYPTVELWINGNGAWDGQGYGGGYWWS